ncbi:MAG: PAS domain S-box protein [Pirellulales bacterium]|nr:PAS domain S-box protein [Pirellulales bacterium]
MTSRSKDHWQKPRDEIPGLGEASVGNCHAPGLPERVAELEQVQVQWERIFHAIGHPAVILDPEHGLLAANRAVCQAAGKTEAELLGKKCYEVFRCPGVTGPPDGCPMVAMRESGSLEVIEMEMEAFGGVYLVSCTPVTDKEGRLQRVIHIATDITERKRVEEALREKEHLLSESQRIAHIGSWRYDLAGRLTWSDEAYRIYGVSPDTFTLNVESFLNLIHREDRPAMQAWIAACLAGEEPDDLEFRSVWPDGTIRFLSGRGELKRDAEHCPLHMTGTVQDITERKQAEEALRTSEAQHRVFADMTSDFVYIFRIGPNGQITLDWMSASFERVTGYTVEEFRASSDPLSNIHPDDQPMVVENHRRIMGGKDTEFETRIVTKGGDVRWVRNYARPIWDAGLQRVTALYGAAQDITQRKRAEEALRESEKKYRTIFQSRSQGFYLMTDVYLDCNEQACRLWACSREDIIGHSPVDFSPEVQPDGRSSEVAVRAYIAAARADTSQRFYWQHRRKDGALIDCEITLDAISLLGGQSVLLATVTDITERTRAARALRRSEARLKSIFRAAPTGIGVVTDRVIKDVNDRLCEMTGYRREELLEQSARMLYVTQEDFDYVGREKYRQIRDAGTGSVETRWKRKDETTIDVLLRSTPLEADNPAAGVTFTALDITERKRAEETLRQSEVRYRELAQRMSRALAVYRAVDDGADFVFVDFNRAGERIEQVCRDDLLGKRITEVFPGVAQFGLLDVLRRVWRTGEPEHFPVSWYRDERVAGWRENFVYRLPSGEVVAVYEDLTQRKQAEAEREELITHLKKQNAELERFAYTVSHDLRTPLISIKWLVGALEEDLAQGDQQQVRQEAQRIAASTDMMIHLLDDVLELSRVGRVVNPPEEVPLADLVENLLPMFAEAVAAKGVQLDVAPALPTLYGDPKRLQEVMQNLLENALKYLGDQTRPRIEIGARQDDAETVCYVRDNGMGIDPRYQEKVFGLFDQLDPNAEGTGIGLALVRQIVEVHGGRIWCESEGPGKGTTFYFSLPRQQEADADAGSA